MKVESQVIANQNVAVNTYLGFVHTARHMQKASFTRKLSFLFLFLQVEKLSSLKN